MTDQTKKDHAISNVAKKPILTARQRADILTNKVKVDIIKKHKLDENGFKYRWANINGATGSNIDKYEQVGYDICLDEEKKPITRTGQSTGVTQYLMRIPIELFKEIQYHKLAEVREIEEEMGKKGNNDLPSPYMYGDVVSSVIK
jgi:hypothetical protein